MNPKLKRTLREKLKRTSNPKKRKQILIALGLESPEATEVVAVPVVEAAPEPVVEVAPVVEAVEVVAEEPAPAPKKKRTYRRRKTTTTKE